MESMQALRVLELTDLMVTYWMQQTKDDAFWLDELEGRCRSYLDTWIHFCGR